MRLKKIILLVVCVAELSFFSAAQEAINFTSLSTKDGLSSNTVNTILKDRFGFLWFGTEDGLDKFDGTNFTVYRHKHDDPSSLQANEILSLHEDNAGNLWVGTSGGSLSLYDRKKDVFINFPSAESQNSISNNVITSICSDYQGKIWLAHYNGVDVLDPVTRKVSKIQPASGSFTAKSCLYIFEDSKRFIWIGTDEGAFRYDPKTKSIVRFSHNNQNALSLADNGVSCIAEDEKGNIWIGTRNGLSMLRSGSNDFTNYTQNNFAGLSSNAINAITTEGDKLWLGTEGGLNILDTKTGKIEKYGFDSRHIFSLTAQAVRSVYLDNKGICWLGMIGGGINKYDRNLNLFNLVRSNVFDERGLNAPVVSSFAEDKNDNLFIGTEGGGLSLFNRSTRLFRHINIKSARKGSDGRITILALERTKKNELLIGTFSDGLFVFDPASYRYKQLMQGTGIHDISSDYIFCFKEDHKGNIWVGTNGAGVNVLNPEKKVIRRYTPNPMGPNDTRLPINGFIRDIEEDRNKNIWIATHGGGIAVLDAASGKFTVYNTTNSKLPNDKVLSLLEDRSGQIWAGTFGGGIAVIQPGQNNFTLFSEKDGLQNNTVYKILEDKNGLVWVTTNQGISSIDFSTKKINNYNEHNGVQDNNFVHGAGLRLSGGELFFGGLEGFNYFNPDYLKKNKNAPSVVITDLRISNRSIAPSEDGPISEHISVAKRIDLDFKQSFALRFVGLNFTSSEQNQYAYKLEGFDKEWTYVGNTNTVSYTNIDPGEYIFRVKASNNDGVWNEEGASIKILVHPPLWRTGYAYTVYALLFAAVLFYLRFRNIRKIKRKIALEQIKIRAEQERKEAERIHELDMLKIKFLTNLSHEFRTPISLILGPADELLARQTHEQSSGPLYMIKRNAKRLLNLVNQLLDFRKMEEQELTLQETEGELVSFIRETSDSFKDLAERKKIGFAFKTSIDQLHTRFDHDKTERILFNVLSNAFKFTLEGGKIMLELETMSNGSDASITWVSIKISDTGIGIPDDKKEKIFERFFQNSTSASILNQGTGIGLSITKEFVKMQGGTIEVESEPEKGSTFKINLPFVILDAPERKNGAAVPPEKQNPDAPLISVNGKKNGAMNGYADAPSILLVEDNEDYRLYLKEKLVSHYKVFEASDGREGWQKTLSNHPQLVVSDISMPNMDGIELTRKIKSDKRTNHIPVVLLTALTGEKDQINGLGTGANDYITKPFNFEVLNAKIRNLLVLNSNQKNTYSKQIKVLTPEIKIESDDERLLHSIMFYLEENLTNPELSVEELSRQIGMSRSSLYAKILELTGETPVEFIRSVKLDKAAALLQKSDMNVAQIAYSVGFSTPNYFAKSFKAKFGMLPSEFMIKARKNNNGNTV